METGVSFLLAVVPLAQPRLAISGKLLLSLPLTTAEERRSLFSEQLFLRSCVRYAAILRTHPVIRSTNAIVSPFSAISLSR